jgi:hypothetical protein
MAKAARFTAITAVAVLVAVAPAAARSQGIHVSFAPQHALQGKDSRIAVTVSPAGVACTLQLRYHDGSYQHGLKRVVARGGRAAWRWTVPTTVQAGQATATVRCGRAGTLTRRLVVVGRLVAPKIIVSKTGFSTKVVGSGTQLSYGLILHNTSSTRDATRVSVQTNFVLADDHLLGTDTHSVALIRAGTDYYYGASVSFPGPAPVARLEVVLQTSGFAPHQAHMPTLANIHLVPGAYNPSWLGIVEGELQNTDPSLSLQSASLSAVVFDSAGNILGGGSGGVYGSLPPGAREFLKFDGGVDVIPTDQAASVQVSVTPMWQQASG